MIKRLRLQNFLSYQDVVIDLSGSTIAVTGENGAGKSSLLEAIPYAYFGLGRETLEGMSRINGDGTHQVTLWDSNDVEIRRGRKNNGQGYFEIYASGKLVAKGREADAWVVTYLGMDSDTFLLTAFFGLQDVRHDTLIRVTPANRLEALQKLAEIGPYTKLLESAKSVLKSAEISKGKLEAKKEGALAAMADAVEMKKSIGRVKKAVKLSLEEQAKLQASLDSMLSEKKKYQKIVEERAGLLIEKQTIDRDIHTLENDRGNTGRILKNTIEASKQCVSEQHGLKLPEITLSDESRIIDDLNTAIGEYTGTADLLATVLESGLPVNKCPLCFSEVADNQLELWRADLVSLREKIDTVKSDMKTRKFNVSEYTRIEKRLSDLTKLIEDYLSKEDTLKGRLSDIDSELNNLKSLKEVKEDRLRTIQATLSGDYQALLQSISDTTDLRDSVIQEISAGNREIRVYETNLNTNVAVKKQIQDYEDSAKVYQKDMEAANLLIEAWSRYGIPMRLIQDLMDSIEDKATLVYQEFDSGRIIVKQVAYKGKPGVEFSLQDRKGDRTFNQLSAGEKVMFFISVRVAISQIVSKYRSVNVDYLILDEAMGNLSPRRRDDLVRLINKVLRKLYPQVVMVSHTEMRDIFTQTLRVTAMNGNSEVTVV